MEHFQGIAVWGCVYGKKALEKVTNALVPYSTTTHPIEEREVLLEPNHTKFILVDDQTEHEFGGEIQFRANLEQVISNGYLASKVGTGPSGLYKNSII